MLKNKILYPIAAGALLAAAAFVTPGYADELSDTRAHMDEIQAQIDEIAIPLEAAQDKYNAAIDTKTTAENRQTEINARIEELENQVAENRKNLGDRVRWIYKNGGTNLLDIILSSNDIVDFIDNISYINALNRGDLAILEKINEEERQLGAEYLELTEKKAEAEEAEEIAREIKDSVQADMDELERTLGELQAEERRQLGYVDGINYTVDVDIPAAGSVVDYALSRKGCPYVWGAAGPSSFDCSGLVMWSYAQVGISLPHNSEAQYAAADAVLPLSQAEPGDVLYRNGHVGICLEPGGTRYVHAPTFGAVVRDTDPLSWSGFTCALRFN